MQLAFISPEGIVLSDTNKRTTPTPEVEEPSLSELAAKEAERQSTKPQVRKD